MKRRVIRLDINTTRVQQLRDVVDVAQEVSSEELAEVSLLSFTTELEDLRECSVFIIIVPTPIDEFKAPDLTPLIKASDARLGTVGRGRVFFRSCDCSVKYCSSGVGLRPDGTPNICCPLSRRQMSSILTSRLLTLKSGIGMASPVSAAVKNRAFSCEHTSATCSAWPAWWRAQHPVYCVGDLPYHRKVHK